MQEGEKEKLYLTIGHNIREARLKAILKQEAFANFLSLSRASVVNIEKGRQHPPLHLLWDMARTLNVSITELLPKASSTEDVGDKWKEIIDKKSMGNEQLNEKLHSFIDKLREISK